ncbi:MAG: CDP-alcohol phosphatidyltransferase family protein [bacterium]|nr:CDP-alcohol phosphatidyltransferase family protein [bacterium]
MKNNLANMVTGIGVIAVILFITLLFKGYSGGIMIFMVVFIGISDLLDGKIARSFKIVSTLGKSLDRARDKLFACTLFGFKLNQLINESGTVSVWASAFLIAILVFEAGLISTWIFGVSRNLDVSAHVWGKRKMCLYFFVAGLFFVDSYFVPVLGKTFFDYMFLFFLFSSAVLAFLSLWGYVERFFPSQK